MKPKVLVLLSDLHVGGTSGLLPPGFTTFEGNEVKQNEYQKWLWSCWLDAWKWVKKVIGKDEWLCVLNGDLIDGNHHFTKEIISADTADHASACLECVSDQIKEADGVYVTEGTHVHSGNQEHGIAKVLEWNGVKVVKANARKSAWPETDIRISGTVVAIDHHVQTTTRSYLEAGAYSTTIADVVNRRSRAGWNVPDVIIRSHRHQYGHFTDGYRSMVILPPWQGSSRFTRRVVTGAIPQCGLVLLDYRECEEGDLPVVKPRIYTPKQSSKYL